MNLTILITWLNQNLYPMQTIHCHAFWARESLIKNLAENTLTQLIGNQHLWFRAKAWCRFIWKTKILNLAKVEIQKNKLLDQVAIIIHIRTCQSQAYSTPMKTWFTSQITNNHTKNLTAWAWFHPIQLDRLARLFRQLPTATERTVSSHFKAKTRKINRRIILYNRNCRIMRGV